MDDIIKLDKLASPAPWKIDASNPRNVLDADGMQTLLVAESEVIEARENAALIVALRNRFESLLAEAKTAPTAFAPQPAASNDPDLSRLQQENDKLRRAVETWKGQWQEQREQRDKAIEAMQKLKVELDQRLAERDAMQHEAEQLRARLVGK